MAYMGCGGVDDALDSRGRLDGGDAAATAAAAVAVNRATREAYCDTTGVEVSCSSDYDTTHTSLTKVPTFLNENVTRM